MHAQVATLSQPQSVDCCSASTRSPIPAETITAPR